MILDIDKVTAIIHDVAQQEIASRFGLLEAADINTKIDANDLVTIADTEAERILTERLCALLPGSIALGEEAAHHDHGLQKRAFAQSVPIWIIDPVDGTKNFAHHRQPFRCMVALYHGGETVAAWIQNPITGDTIIAEKGSGAHYNTIPVRVRDGITAAIEAKGFLISYACDRLRKHYGHHDFFDTVAHYSCCGAEYEEIGRGLFDFCAYRTLKPWDHAPGTLIVRESGGIARYIKTEGAQDYHPNGHGTGLLCAATEELWAELNTLLMPVFGR
ncbi:MAG: inositol monophosphatase [Pseudomonadota bacterium]